MGARVLVAVVGVLGAGCATPDDEVPPCEFVVDEISLDFEVPTGFPGGAVVPSEVLDAITRPIAGELAYRGEQGKDWIGVTPDSGTTMFTSTIRYKGPAVWSRVPDASGDLLLKCNPTIQFPVEIDFETEDGVFDETWNGLLISSILGTGAVTIEVESDVEEQFAVMRGPKAEQLETESYIQTLQYGTCVEDCGTTQAMSGAVRFRGLFPATMDGEIIDQMGINITLAEWTGFAVE